MLFCQLGITQTNDPKALKVSKSTTTVKAVKVEPPVNNPEVGKRYALVIGNSTYRNTAPLANPVNDARSVCKLLSSLRFEVDCRENLQQRGSFKEAVSDFTRKISPTDVALFYYAGHGLELEGENYLVPTEANIRSKAYVEDEAVRVNFVFDELAAAKPRLSIIILDACRDNPFKSLRSMSAGSGLAIPAGIPSGSIIIFPTSPGKPALDGNGEHGVFTSHLLQHMPTTGITIEEMFKRVISGVRTESMASGMEQVPWMNLSFTGEFCFVGCGTRISEDDYANVVKAKQEIENNTQLLQSELSKRETELQQFKARMTVMKEQFDSQQQSQNLSQTELNTLSQQRDELIAKTTYLQAQEQELKRVKTELERMRNQQAEFTQNEKDMALARERIAMLERKIVQQESRKVGDSELELLRQERDRLVNSNAELQQSQKGSVQAQLELAALQKRLVEYDRQKGELDSYKQKLVQLESDNRQKEESVRQMRNELEKRQQALTEMKDRMTSLQEQLNEQHNAPHVDKDAQERLQKERNELAHKAQQLEAREKDLLEARRDLERAEKQGSDQARKELLVLQNRLTEYDRQKDELDRYKSQMAHLEKEQQQMQIELTKTQKKLENAAVSTVKDAAFVPPAM